MTTAKTDFGKRWIFRGRASFVVVRFEDWPDDERQETEQVT
jgi:hypothetical protein